MKIWEYSFTLQRHAAPNPWPFPATRCLGSFGAGLGYNTELFPTQIRGAAVGTAFTFGSAAAAFSPAIVGWIATSYSIAAALPLLALSFFLLVPMFLFVARETTRKELVDFIGQRT